MIERWLLASLHLLALPLGVSALWMRERALASLTDPKGLRAAFAADNLWGLSALLWVATGLIRLLGVWEKPSAYYFHDHAFSVKMGLFVAIVVLEIWPMTALVRWRIALRRGTPLALGSARALTAICRIQGLLLVAMIFAATAVARGYFY